MDNETKIKIKCLIISILVTALLVGFALNLASE
jgi:hypothetical protein